MSITETIDRLDQAEICMNQLHELNALPTLTKQQQRLHATLLAEISLLKAGATKEEVRTFERRKLLEAAGFRMGETPTGNLPRIPEAADKEWRMFLNGEKLKPIAPASDAEKRDQQAGTQSISYTQAAAGGTLVPQGFADRVWSQMRHYDELYDPNNCTVIPTENGNNMPFPILDDTAAAASLVSEAGQIADQGLVGNITPPAGPNAQPGNLGAPSGPKSVSLGAFKFTSGNIRISLELLDDSSFPLPALIERAAAIRFARGVGYYMVQGSGINQPTGLITAALANGATILIAAGAATNDGGAETGSNSIGSIDLWKCLHNLDPAYRYNARWLMRDETLESVRQLNDKQGHPLFNLDNNGMPYLCGKPVVVSPSMPTMASAVNSVLFYNPDYFVSRRVGGVDGAFFKVLRERFIDFGEVAVLGFLRTDSNLLSTGTGKIPVTVIQNHS